MAVFVTSVSFTDLQKCLKEIKVWDGAARALASKALQKGTQRIAANARRRVAVRSGTLKKSIKSSYKEAKLTGYTRAKTPYAHLIEFGARAAVATPKNKKAMKLPAGGGDGQKEYAGKVNIPARSPHPFVTPAFEEEKPRIIEEVKRGIEDAKAAK
jgi:HK97 gp10 family phage protein